MTLLAILLVFPEERPNRQRIIGLTIGFVGVLVVVGVWQGLGGGTLIGICACIIAITCHGISYPYGRRHLTGGPLASDLTPLALATGVLVMGTIQTAPIALVTGVMVAPLQTSTVIAMLGLGCLGERHRLHSVLLGLGPGRRNDGEHGHLHPAAHCGHHRGPLPRRTHHLEPAHRRSTPHRWGGNSAGNPAPAETVASALGP